MFAAALAFCWSRRTPLSIFSFCPLSLLLKEKQRRRALLLAAVGLLYFVLAILWLQWRGRAPCSGATPI